MKQWKVIALLSLSAGVVSLVSGCGGPLNCPYTLDEVGENVYFTSFSELPKHLDPAVSYSSDEYGLICQIYEPPLQYHYLERPYRLVPLTAVSVPVPVYYDASGAMLPADAPVEKVARVVYEIRIKKGIFYQDHPCFAKDEQGRYVYRGLTEADVRGIYQIGDFEHVGTRELTAADYVYQIKRMADPRIHCPILGLLEKYILGMDAYAAALRKQLEEIRERRRKAAGALYNRELDERRNPIVLDYDAAELEGVQLVDKYTYRIILKRKYPQMIYWLAMPFFSPMPREAVEFYSQPVLQERNITLDRFPVGTGPYRMEKCDPNSEIILVRNENFRDERYPAAGEAGDEAAGLLEDAGKRLPFIDRIVYSLEKESIPRWLKFVQGYYDASGISSDVFSRVISFTAQGDPALSDFLSERGVELVTSASTTTFYFGFNMMDDVVGGYSEEKCKLRQAIKIAIDTEEFIQIFFNGRGIPAQSPLPPGIFGYEAPPRMYDSFVYDWDETRGVLRRKSVEYARKLLAEAGYPGGRDADGRPLVIGFDNAWVGAESLRRIRWLQKQFAKLGIHLENRATDYNRFREKMNTGNFQMFFWGWNADYPDPENFLFLLYGPNGKVKHHGENAANYDNPRFNELFRRMEHMENSPRRLAIIREMVRIFQHDSPWVGVWHPKSFVLFHSWVKNVKPNTVANNTMKYRRIDPDERLSYVKRYNRPVLWPLWMIAAVGLVLVVPAALKMAGVWGRA